MILEVSQTATRVDFFPATIIDEIVQNVYTIISTPEFSVPLYRKFGNQMSYLDSPDEMMKARTISEIMDKVEEFESRVVVEEVKFRGNQLDGRVYPAVTIRIKEGVINDEQPGAAGS